MIIKIVDIIILMDIKTETIAKGTIIIIIATFASKILGFIREILIAKYYGASVITDSYLIATILPSALAGIIGGALTTVFIPLFIEERNKNGDQKAWEVASSVIITSVIFLGIATLAAYFISPYFIQLVAPGFDLERYSLSLRLNRIMLPSIIFHGLLGLLTGVLQAYRHFSIPALAALMYNIFLISFITIFYLNPVIGLGIGNLTGIITQAFLVTIYLFKWKKLSLKDFKANFFHPIIKKIFFTDGTNFFRNGY
jgi:putative peptidoglycan lipid II flippase